MLLQLLFNTKREKSTEDFPKRNTLRVIIAFISNPLPKEGRQKSKKKSSQGRPSYRLEVVTMTLTKSELQSQLQAVLAQLEHYKATSKYLQCKMDKKELVKILQEQMKTTLEIQNQILEKNNEGLRKMLSDKDEEISKLKSHNQNLEDHIKKSKNDNKSPYGSNNELKRNKVSKQAHHGQRC